MLAWRSIRIAILYTVCIVTGALAGLLASGLIIRNADGPKCCSPGDGIGMMLLAIPLVPLGGIFGLIIIATILRIIRSRAAGHEG